MSIVAALADLVLPGACPGCAGPTAAGQVCPACLTSLRAGAAPARPEPCPSGLPPCTAVGGYVGSLRALLLAYKDDGRGGLARPLGAALSGALLVAAGGQPAVVVVPVPRTRARGHPDHVLRLARRAVWNARRAGLTVQLWPGLVVCRRLADQRGLDAGERAANLAGAFAVRRQPPPGRLVLIDDVLTTGATLAEAARALRAADAEPAAAAVVAATARRTAAGTPAGPAGRPRDLAVTRPPPSRELHRPDGRD